MSQHSIVSEITMAQYSLPELRTRAFNSQLSLASDPRAASSYLRAIYAARFGWCIDPETRLVPDFAMRLSRYPSTDENDALYPNDVAWGVPEEVWRQLTTRPFASAMEISVGFAHEEYLLGNINPEHLGHQVDEDVRMENVMKVLQAEALGVPLPQEIVGGLWEFTIIPKRLII